MVLNFKIPGGLNFGFSSPRTRVTSRPRGVDIGTRPGRGVRRARGEDRIGRVQRRLRRHQCHHQPLASTKPQDAPVAVYMMYNIHAVRDCGQEVFGHQDAQGPRRQDARRGAGNDTERSNSFRPLRNWRRLMPQGEHLNMALICASRCSSAAGGRGVRHNQHDLVQRQAAGHRRRRTWSGSSIPTTAWTWPQQHHLLSQGALTGIIPEVGERNRQKQHSTARSAKCLEPRAGDGRRGDGERCSTAPSEGAPGRDHRRKYRDRIETKDRVSVMSRTRANLKRSSSGWSETPAGSTRESPPAARCSTALSCHEPIRMFAF